MAQHRRKGAQFQAVTANRLEDGIVVYLTEHGGLVESLQDAFVADGQDAADALLAKAEPLVADNLIVEPYLFAVEPEGEKWRAASVRETIRQAGPTVRLDLGKQAAVGG